MKLSLNDKRFLQYLGLLVTLYILPIILADFYFVDDIGRSIHPEHGWLTDGRLLTQLLFYILSFGNQFLDISPLTQIVSGFLMICIGFLLYRQFLSSFQPFISSLCVFLFTAHPYMLGSISFKYDSISISLAIFLSVLAFTILVNQNGKLTLLYSTLCLSGTFFTYQPMSNILIGLSIIYIVQRTKQKHISIKDYSLLIKVCIIFGLAYGIYKVIATPFLGGWGWAHQQFLNIDIHLFGKIYDNLYQAMRRFSLVFLDFGAILTLAIPFLMMLLMEIYDSIKTYKKAHSIPVINFLTRILSYFILYFLMLLFILPLKTPTFSPLVFIGGFSVWIFFTFLNWIQYFNKMRYLQYMIIFPVLYCITFSYSYGNVQKSQKNFKHQVISYIIEDLKSTDNINQIHKIIVLNDYPLAPEAKIILKKKPYMRMLIKGFINTDTIHHRIILKNVEQVLFAEDEPTNPILKRAKTLPILKENPIYTLKVVNNTALIEYKHTP